MSTPRATWSASHNLPAWNAVDVSNGRSLLNSSSRSLQSYRQTLDMYDGVLRTAYDWADGDRVMAIRVETFVSRADASLGAVKLEITPRFAGPVKVLLPLTAWPEPKRYLLDRLEKLPPEAARDQQAIWYPGHMIPRRSHAEAHGEHGLIEMLSQAAGTQATVAEAVALAWPAAFRRAQKMRPSSSLSRCIPDSRIRSTNSRSSAKTSMPPPKSPPRRCTAATTPSSRTTSAPGTTSGAATSSSKATPALQTVIHSMLFYLLGSAREDLDVSIPPMGLSTAGYYGHYFWDADTYMFPPLLLLHPALAKPV